MAKFAVGDRVRLVSGGPVMTVQGEAAMGGGILTAWFDSKNQVKRASFPEEALVKVDPTAPSNSKFE